MNTTASQYTFLLNGAIGPADVDNPIVLDYQPSSRNRNMKIGLPKFVKSVYHLPNRVLDLLEIASFVFAADRRAIRGSRRAVEFQAWSRTMRFYMKVRDIDFWSDPGVSEALSEALTFMSGDAEYSFQFEPGHTTPPTSLFDRRDISMDINQSVSVALFSGGLDSLCGAVDRLTNTEEKVVLVSHQSQSSTVHTQNQLVCALHEKFPNRLWHYPFVCSLSGSHAKEESQRTRAFLYNCIAYAIASVFHQDRIFVYENGVTSVNLSRREDLMNARASRTTHPKTIGLMTHFLSLVDEKDFTVSHPYLYKTKADIISSLAKEAPNLISSAVSCTRAFKTNGPATHCGECFQCVDRRLAAHANSLDHLDHRGLYSIDFIGDPIEDAEAKTVLLDYIRQAISLSKMTLAKFEKEYFSELVTLLDYLPSELSDAEKIRDVWKLYLKHGEEVCKALRQIRENHDDIIKPIMDGTILQLINERAYLKSNKTLCMETILRLLPALGEMFSDVKPKDEPDLNKKLSALIGTHYSVLKSEYPAISFACAKVIPDHTVVSDYDILIETKYIRGSTSPSKATDGIAADITKYPSDALIIFVVYDPHHKIPKDKEFCSDIESYDNIVVSIIR